MSDGLQMDEEAIRARNRRNIWMALALLGFVVLMGVGTAIRIKEGAGTQPCQALYWDPIKEECIDPDIPDLEKLVEEVPG